MSHLLSKGTFVIMSGDAPKYADHKLVGTDKLERICRDTGLPVLRVTGIFDGVKEQSLIIRFDTVYHRAELQAELFGNVMSRLFGQECYILANNDRFTLVFPRSPSCNTHSTSLDYYKSDQVSPDDYITVLPNGDKIQINF